MRMNLDFNVVGEDMLYQRTSNFAVQSLEKRLADMYGASQVLLTGSGMEAITSVIEYLMPVSGTILIPDNLYAESRLWLKLIERYRVLFADFKDIAAFDSLVQAADVVFFDVPSVFGEHYDVKLLTKLAHNAGARVMVDNSLLSLHLNNPIKDGADIVVESYSKYVVGYGDASAGAIVFGYEDKNIARQKAFFGWRGRCVYPEVAYKVERGLDSLGVRMERQIETASFIEEKLVHANIPVMTRIAGVILIKESALPCLRQEFCSRLKLFKTMANYGATYSTVTPSFAPDLYTEDIGNYVRLSCGLEDKEALWADLSEALDREGK